MDKIRKRLEKLTGDVLNSPYDPTSEIGMAYTAELKTLQELSKTLKIYDTLESALPAAAKKRLDILTTLILEASHPPVEECDSYVEELKLLQTISKTWDSFDGVEIFDESPEERGERKSTKTWDKGEGSLTASISLEVKQKEAMAIMDDAFHDKFLAVGGSGSGKSYVQAYKIIRDSLRHKAPCLIARDKMTDLSQGMIDQIIPTILQKIAEANGQEDWKKWTIDGLKFAKWSEKKSKLEFATGGYIRFAGLSARDLSESGSDKILSPSWLHVMVEEVSEDEYEIIEMLLTRLRYHVDGVLNKMLMCENPPSVNHWSYRRFFEKKRLDGTPLSHDEMGQHAYLEMSPQDNANNLSENYIRNLSQFTGANYERFFLGKFQETESGEIFKRMQWTDNMPRPYDWEKLIIYTDPTPLTGKEHSVWADYKASVLCGLFAGTTFVLDVRMVKGSTLDMLQNIKQLWDVSPNQSITEIWMEKKQVPSDFKQVLLTFSTMTGWMCPIQMDTRVFGDKKATIETFLQPLFENDLIYFNEAFRETERGRQTQFQILKFSRKTNKNVHDDIPDAIMRADTKMKGRGKKKRVSNQQLVGFVDPAYVQRGH